MKNISPEVKAILGDYVRRQKEKYGDDWKAIKSAEMAAKTAPVAHKLITLLKEVKR